MVYWGVYGIVLYLAKSTVRANGVAKREKQDTRTNGHKGGCRDSWG
jgi:hypothetical protein